MKKIFLNDILIFWCWLFFIGYATQNSTAQNNIMDLAENWGNVKSINNFIGKWEGNIIQDIPRNNKDFIPNSSIETSVFLEYVQDSEVVNAYLKIDMEKFITDWSRVPQVKQAGFTKEKLWRSLVNEFKKDKFTIGENYSLILDLSEKANTFLSDSSVGQFQINETGNKIKLIFDEIVTFGLGDSGFNEIVMNKK
jgi:hypothetical protein